MEKKPEMKAVTQFSPEEIEIMAKMEHARWNAERYLDGWTLGPKDSAKKITPYLVAYDELSEEIKGYDRETAVNIPRLLGLTGKIVVRDAR